MKKSRTTSAAFAAVTICLFTAATTHAAELKVSGTVVQVIVSKEEQKLDDGRTILHAHEKGIVETNDPKSPLNLTTRECSGTGIMDTKGNFVDGGGYCDNFDKSGDSYWNTWKAAPEGGNIWSVYHGTGKFAGMSGGGTIKIIAYFPDRYDLAFEGTLTMK